MFLIHTLLTFARNGNILPEGSHYAANDYSCIRGIKQLAIMMKISGSQQSVLNWRSTGLEMHRIKNQGVHVCWLMLRRTMLPRPRWNYRVFGCRIAIERSFHALLHKSVDGNLHIGIFEKNLVISKKKTSILLRNVLGFICTLFYESWAFKSLVHFQIIFFFISNLLIKKMVLKSFSYFDRCSGTIHDQI